MRTATLSLRGVSPQKSESRNAFTLLLTPRFGVDGISVVFSAIRRILGVPRGHPDGTRPRLRRSESRGSILKNTAHFLRILQLFLRRFHAKRGRARRQRRARIFLSLRANASPNRPLRVAPERVVCRKSVKRTVSEIDEISLYCPHFPPRNEGRRRAGSGARSPRKRTSVGDAR